MTADPSVFFEQVEQHLGVANDTMYRWWEYRGLPAYCLGCLYKFKLPMADNQVPSGGADESSSSEGSGRADA